MNRVLAAILLALGASAASAIPLDTIKTYQPDSPLSSQQNVLCLFRGTGTDNLYVPEVNPLTGELPVTAAVGAVTATTAYKRGPGGVYADVSPTYDTTTAANNRPMPMQIIAGDSLGPVSLNYGAPGATTLRSACMLGLGTAAVDNTNPVPVSDAGGSLTVDGTVAATQSGTWDIRDITGTVSLPTGASTAANQATANTSLSSIDGKLPATLGQKTMANSLAVAIASDQTAVPATQSGTWDINNVSGTVSLPTGAATAANQVSGNTTLSSINTDTTGIINLISAFSVGTGNDVPGSAVYIGAQNTSGDLEGLLLDASGNLKTVSVFSPNVSDFGATASALRTASVIGNTSGAAAFGAGTTSAQTLRVVLPTDQTSIPSSNFPATVSTNFGAPGASTVRVAAELGVGGSAVANGNPVPVSDAGGSLTVDGTVTQGTSAIGANHGYGKLTCSALSGTYATVVATTFTTCMVQVFNSCDNTIKLSLNGGTTDSFELEAYETVALDLCSNGRHIASSVNLQAKHAGVAPTTGTLRIAVE